MKRTTDITMVHAAKIASLGYPGCKTVQGVANFCQKNKRSVNCVWWKNQNHNILLVDPQSFKQCYKKTTMGTTTKTGGRSIKRTKTTGHKKTRHVTKRRRIY